jgi:hypothetical protein
MAEVKQPEDWMSSKWRPMMGWMYMSVCVCDFMLFPVLWSILQALGNHGHVESQWNPITLQGAGLFHLAMGAVLGIAAYGRTQEKLNGAEMGGLQAVGQSVTTTYRQPSAGGFANTGNVNSPATSSFSGSTSSAVPAYKTTPTVATSSTGKNMPAPQVDEPL